MSDKSKWKDHVIPASSIIHKVELMLRKDDSVLCGIKFIDSDNKTLFACGYINRIERRNDTVNYVIREVVLVQGERLLGVKSGGRG